ncbi:MAG TPA: PAS domain S-box protein [Polyangiaceae bacterium]|nr:PAS domain S-box protein [Polyangiaceae bacterium]
MADSPVPGIGQLLADVQLIERLGDVIPGLVYVYDLSERCNVYTNRALCELLGYSPAQMRGMGDAVVRTIVHPEDAPTVSEHYARIIRESGGGVSELEYRIRSSAGRLYWLHTWESVLADPDGRARFVLGVAQDVTARVAGEETLREAMQALLESEQRWRSIVENPFDFVVVIDREYKYTFVNFVAPGLQLEDLLGKATPFDFIASSDHERVRAALDGVFELARPASYEVYIPSLDRWFLSVVGPIRQGTLVTHLSILTRETSVEKRLEAERSTREEELARKNAELEQALENQRALEAKLTQAAKLEAVGRLAGGIAHDFNNLLTGISGVISLVSARLPQNDSMRIDVTDLQEAVERGAGLTRQLLAFSRQQVLAQSTLDLNEVIGAATRVLSRLIGENIDLRFPPTSGLWTISCNRSQVEQILMNLAVNARDAMPAGGKLLLEVSNVLIDASYCEAQPDAVPGKFVRLTVTDSGTGMDAATKARIFEPFFTTKPLGSGTGLGLATVYGIVRQCGGFIHVYSELEQGTSFKIYWPATEGGSAEVVIAPRERPEGEETILVVEDEQLVLRLVRRMLQSLGYAVITASRGDEALRMIESGARFDLLLTDVILPGCDGHTLFKRAVTLRPGIAAVFMSGYTDEFIAINGIVDAGGHFLQKPFSSDELARIVRTALDARARRAPLGGDDA